VNEFGQKFSKIAEITVLFWLMKVVSTTLGETLGDFLSMTLELGYLTGIAITSVFFLIALSIQLKAPKYVPHIFWLVIIATTTLGTEISDFLDRSLHLGYARGSLALLTGLIATLMIWFKSYGNLAVSDVIDRKKEMLFWMAVLFSNSLGTAFGDFLSDEIGLSYLQGALITSGFILLVIALHYLTRINDIVLFWIAFIFTRPFGATFGDLLTKPLSKGGLNIGTFFASIVSLFLLSLMVYLSQRKMHKTKLQ
jgi:uncharacterized membrane-anchored protein